LFGLLLSLSIYHPGERVHCLVDSSTKKTIQESTPKINLDIVWHVKLDKYSNMNRQEMVSKGIWSEFQMMKAEVINLALQTDDDTLFLDADMIILDVIDGIDKSKQLGLSPHYIRKRDTDLYGYYNGGMLWTNQKTVKEDWIEFTKTSRFFDQASIEDLAKKYSYFIFGENYNFSWWRVAQSDISPQAIISNISVKDMKLHYKKKSLKIIHTHFHDKTGAASQFNQLMVNLLTKIKDYKSLLIISRMVDKKWIIYLPKQPMGGLWVHNNDSFRELVILLKIKNKDVDVEFNKSGHVWIKPDILLYDRPTLRWMKDTETASLLLLGNGSMKEEGLILKQTLQNVKPWIFWPRRPMVLEKLLSREGVLDWKERATETLFIGNYENNVQKKYRKTNHDWKSVLDEYHCTSGQKHKFTQGEYLMKLRGSKYGLCLRGYGSKCHREVELMAFGTVPIVTPEVSIKDYMDPPIENVHYLKVNNPEELKDNIANISKEKWEEMSKACYEWYQRNVHSDNCWKNMIENILYIS
jgi:hypothetical protein